MHSFTFSPVSPGIWLAAIAFVSFHVAYLPAPGKSVSYFCPNSTGSWKTLLYTFPTSLMKITGRKGRGDTDIAVLAAKAAVWAQSWLGIGESTWKFTLRKKSYRNKASLIPLFVELLDLGSISTLENQMTGISLLIYGSLTILCTNVFAWSCSHQHQRDLSTKLRGNWTRPMHKHL